MFARIAVKPSRKNTSFVPSRKFATEAPVAKTSINFVLACPHETLFSKEKNKQVKNIRIPGVTGEFGITPNTVSTVAELRPGLVTVTTEESQKPEQFFVSGGFAIITEGNCKITTPEAFSLEELDPEAARAGFKKFQEDLAKADSQQAKAAAMIGVEVHSALCAALGVAP